MINANFKHNSKPNPNPNPNLNPYPSPIQKPNHYPHSNSVLSEISAQEEFLPEQMLDHRLKFMENCVCTKMCSHIINPTKFEFILQSPNGGSLRAHSLFVIDLLQPASSTVVDVWDNVGAHASSMFT